jgi:hypothetical protein
MFTAGYFVYYLKHQFCKTEHTVCVIIRRHM